MRWKAVSSIVLGFVISIVLPFALLNLGALKGLESIDLFAYGMGFVLLMTTILYSVVLNEAAQTRATMAAVKSSLDTDVVNKVVHLSESLNGSKELVAYMVDRDKVYEKLTYFVANARKRVDLMYCGDRPPSGYLRSQSKESYVGELDNIIKAHGKTVRRIIRYTDANRDWIRSVINAHRGNDQFSLSILFASAEIPLVSAQVIDGERAILMNLDPSNAPNRSRDFIFESAAATTAIDFYYNKMFDIAMPILTNGRLEEANYAAHFA